MTPRPRAWRSVVLRNAAAFEQLLKNGRRIASRNFLVRARPNDLTHARLGIIAARKVAPRAVDRNRGKRLIRDAFRSTLENLAPIDVAVQLRSNLRRVPAAELRMELHVLFQQLESGGAPAARPPIGQ